MFQFQSAVKFYRFLDYAGTPVLSIAAPHD